MCRGGAGTVPGLSQAFRTPGIPGDTWKGYEMTRVTLRSARTGLEPGSTDDTVSTVRSSLWKGENILEFIYKPRIVSPIKESDVQTGNSQWQADNPESH